MHKFLCPKELRKETENWLVEEQRLSIVEIS